MKGGVINENGISLSGYHTKNNRIVLKFEELMEKWDPTTHNSKYKKLPYFKGIMGREEVAGFSYVDSDMYESLCKVQWVKVKHYVKFNFSSRNCQRLGIKDFVSPNAYEFLHKEVMNTDEPVDHVHNLTLDNRKHRLRKTTPCLNGLNSRPSGNTSTGVKNLNWKRGRL